MPTQLTTHRVDHTHMWDISRSSGRQKPLPALGQAGLTGVSCSSHTKSAASWSHRPTGP